MWQLKNRNDPFCCDGNAAAEDIEVPAVIVRLSKMNAGNPGIKKHISERVKDMH